jgi:hypothetical protein
MAGLNDLRAQLFDTDGVNSGSAISAGFVEIGSGNYIWTYSGFADDFRGGVKFYRNSAPSTILASTSINPATSGSGGAVASIEIDDFEHALADAVAGGLRPSQTITWTRADGTAENLSGATITARIRSREDGTARAAQGTFTVTDAANGVFRWDYHVNDLVAGKYTVQFNAAFGSSPTPARTIEANWTVHRAI